MSSGNSKTSNFYRLLLSLSGKKIFKKSDKCIALSIFSIYYTWKNINKSYNNNEFKILTPMWNKKLELPERLYFLSDIQVFGKYIIKKYETVTDNLPINKIENGVTFKTKIDII